MTRPSPRMAAKARCVACTYCTVRNLSCASKLPPPYAGSPHVRIRSPPGHHMAKARSVAATLVGSATAVRLSPSLKPQASKVCIPSSRTSPATNLRNPCWRARWAASFKAKTRESCGTATISQRPLGRTTRKLQAKLISIGPTGGVRKLLKSKDVCEVAMATYDWQDSPSFRGSAAQHHHFLQQLKSCLCSLIVQRGYGGLVDVSESLRVCVRSIQKYLEDIDSHLSQKSRTIANQLGNKNCTHSLGSWATKTQTLNTEKCRICHVFTLWWTNIAMENHHF